MHTDTHADIAARHHARRPLPDDALANAVRDWRDCRRTDAAAEARCREAVAAELDRSGLSAEAGLIRTVSDVGIEVDRYEIIVTH